MLLSTRLRSCWNAWMETSTVPSDRGYRSPAEIICHLRLAVLSLLP